MTIFSYRCVPSPVVGLVLGCNVSRFCRHTAWRRRQSNSWVPQSAEKPKDGHFGWMPTSREKADV